MTDRHVRVHDFAARRQCDWAARRVRVHAIAPEGSVIVLPGKFEFMPLPCRQKEIVLPDGVMALIFSSVMADVLFAAAVLLAVSYCYLTYVYGYWKRRGVHYMRPALLVGNLGGVFMQVEGPLDLFRRAYEEAVGHPIVGIFIFHKPFLVVRDLEVVRIILAKEAHAFLDRFFLPPEKVDRLFARSLFARKGGEWKHLRVKMSPTFTSGKLKMMFQMVDECGRQLMTCIEEAASKDKSVVVKDAMSRYTMDIIASYAFGVRANALEDPDCEFITKTKGMFQPTGIQMFFGTLMLFTPFLQKFVSKKIFENDMNDFVRKTFWEVVNYRREKGIVRKDFVHLLMQLQEEGEVRAEDAKDLEEIQQDNKYMATENSKTEKSNIAFEDDDFAAQALLFIAAGFETSSSVLTFTLFELAMNTDIQDRLRAEVEATLDKHGNKLTYDSIAEMSYLDMVVSESMRKYSPLMVLDRVCLSDCKIEGTDITIEKGTVVLIPVHGIHYDPNNYPDPQKFNPERFSTENKAKRHHFAFLPFGEGPRKCIGMRLGLLQVKTALVHILKTFQVRPCKDTPRSPLEMKRITGTLATEKDIILAFMKLK